MSLAAAPAAAPAAHRSATSSAPTCTTRRSGPSTAAPRAVVATAGDRGGRRHGRGSAPATACRSCPAAQARACPAVRTRSRAASCCPPSGCAAIVEINAGERLAVVQPGVVNDVLRAAVAEHGLWYPPDPASAPWSTIGGNVATNAGGLCCVKYGVTRDYVLALEVVTASGEVVRLGRRTAKGVAGYDLVGLMVGSEGTLGVVTEVTVRLRPAGRRRRARSSGSSTPSPRRRRGRAASRPGACSPAAFELVDRALPAGGERVEAHRAARTTRRRCCSPRPTCPSRPGAQEAEAILAEFEAAGARDADRVHRPGRGRGAVRRPPPGLPGAGAARRRRCSPKTSACRADAWPRCSRGSTRSAAAHDIAHRHRRPRRRRQPAPAADHPARRRRGAGARAGGVRARSSTPRSTWAARSPASTASAC